ncbi:MAG: glycoside hydrolase family 65 protein, partial [Microbacteriaceae bacterium]|nr:glycoside hydrolase family 65 protein [Microbacteriaceae bacterium]
FWQRSDIQIDAEPGVQQAVRWNLFQLAQAAARADGRGIAAKGLTGSGYSGHYFWYSDIFVLPFLTYTTPLWARNALRSRLRMLPKARLRATQLNEDGALFPWRTINGDEASAYYAAGTAAYHINADITYACARYFFATGDLDFLLAFSEIPIETARLWVSLGFWATNVDGIERFHIHGVTGPDEYTTVVNDNLFTNVMARFNLRIAVEAARILEHEHPEAFESLSARLGLRREEIDAWQRAADGMSIPYSEELGIHPQDAHFLEREVWDLAATPPDKKPLLLHFHPLVIYRFQVLKQADVVLALLLASEEFSDEEKRRNFEYYDALTTGDSSLSGVVQSVLAAEVGYRELAYRYFTHALHLDLANLHHNSVDGVHIASAGGVWMAIVQGFAGMRDAERTLSFDPRLPAHWQGVQFRLHWRGRTISVALNQGDISFEIGHEDLPVPVWVRGEQVTLDPGVRVSVPLQDQGPDLGEFRGLSAGMLPRDGEHGAGQEFDPAATTGAIHIPTLPPTQAGGAGYEDPE